MHCFERQGRDKAFVPAHLLKERSVPCRHGHLPRACLAHPQRARATNNNLVRPLGLKQTPPTDTQYAHYYILTTNSVAEPLTHLVVASLLVSVSHSTLPPDVKQLFNNTTVYTPLENIQATNLTITITVAASG